MSELKKGPKKQQAKVTRVSPLMNKVRGQSQGKTKNGVDLIAEAKRSRVDKAIELVISAETLSFLQRTLIDKYSELITQCMISQDSELPADGKRELRKDAKNPHDLLRYYISVECKPHFNKMYSVEENIDYIHDEIVGTGFIERLIVEHPEITDIDWDATHLRAVSNDKEEVHRGEDIGFDEQAALRLVNRFTIMNKVDINQTSPLFNGTMGNMRMSATHSSVSPYGLTFSLRVTRPRLVLNEASWKKQNFAPMFVLDWFKSLVYARSNIVISGETGSGKTELQKFILGFAKPDHKFYLIEDVNESHLKELYPDRIINSTLTNTRISISDQVAQALRNYPQYIIVSETRGGEAYEMLQAVLSGHTLVTTLHAKDAAAIPRRFVNMCLASGRAVSEKMLTDDIYSYFDFGVHLKVAFVNGVKTRYLHELVEFNSDGSTTTIFRQTCIDGKFKILALNDFSDEIYLRVAEAGKTLFAGDRLKKQLMGDRHVGVDTKR